MYTCTVDLAKDETNERLYFTMLLDYVNVLKKLRDHEIALIVLMIMKILMFYNRYYSPSLPACFWDTIVFYPQFTVKLQIEFFICLMYNILYLI